VFPRYDYDTQQLLRNRGWYSMKQTERALFQMIVPLYRMFKPPFHNTTVEVQQICGVLGVLC
jgi:hypothetical protein